MDIHILRTYLKFAVHNSSVEIRHQISRTKV